MSRFDMLQKFHDARRVLPHKKFLELMFDAVSRNKGEFVERRNEIYLDQGRKFGSFCYTNDETSLVCPEPFDFIDKFKGITNPKEADLLFREVRKEFTVVNTSESQAILGKGHELSNILDKNIWFNSTLNGVNLRPGFLDKDIEKPYAIPLCDLTVHGVIVGRTGAGKSVLLNNLIFNLLVEYPPWELDLYLADFKRVEFSRYMAGRKTPHIKALATTSEIRYVVSLFKKLERSMQARNKLCEQLGLTNIKKLREKYKIVLPRAVLIVDEFQQLFLEATEREGSEINDLILALTKQGRAMGFHLLFASQEMAGALGGKTLANFNIRIALPCEPEVSSAILGNSAAARDIGVGEVIVNTASGNEDKNQHFKVPFINVDDDFDLDTGQKIFVSDFDAFLDAIDLYARKSGFTKTGKHYDEYASQKIEGFEHVILSNPKYIAERNRLLKQPDLFDVFTLGESVVYNDKIFDYECFFVERGKNRNILALSTSIKDLSYLTKLLAINFKHSPNEMLKSQANHYFFHLNSVAQKMYDINQSEEGFSVQNIMSEDYLEEFVNIFRKRMLILSGLRQSFDSLEDYLRFTFEAYADVFRIPAEDFEPMLKIVLSLFEGNEPLNLLKQSKTLLGRSTLTELEREVIELVIPYAEQSLTDKPSQIFESIICWISGLENVEKPPQGLEDCLKNAMDVNMLFIMFSHSVGGIFYNVLPCCDYVFVSGTNPNYYERCDIRYTRKSHDSISIDFKIRSVNTERSFKKFEYDHIDYTAPSLDYDEIMGSQH